MVNFPKINYEKIVKQEVQVGMLRLQAYIGKRMNRRAGSVGNIAGVEVFSPSSSKQLDVRSGKLLRSFSPSDPNNIFELKWNGNKLTGEFGSKLPYAAIHEYGGFIKSKGKMAKYFWYKYMSTGNPYYRSLALAVEKRGGVQIPKREYFEKGINDFLVSSDGFNTIADGIIDAIGDAFNAN